MIGKSDEVCGELIGKTPLLYKTESVLTCRMKRKADPQQWRKGVKKGIKKDCIHTSLA